MTNTAKTTRPETLELNRGDWTGKATTATITRDGDRITFSLSHLPGEAFEIHEIPSLDDGGFYGEATYVLRHEGRRLATGTLFDDGWFAIHALGIERDAQGKNAVVTACAQLVSNIL